MAKILVLEDDNSIHSLIKLNLIKANHIVIDAFTVEEAIAKFLKNKDIEIAILDVMLPDGSGVNVCEFIRKTSITIGIMMLTAKSQETDKVVALESGADDYMTKPFSPTELLARINALYRRVSIHIDKTFVPIISSNTFVLHLSTRECFKDDEEIQLTPTEFTMLKYFIENAGKIITREELLTKIWGESFYGDIKIVDVNIRRLRRKIEIDSSKPNFIETIWGKGYIWRDKSVK